VFFVVFLCSQVTTFPSMPNIGLPSWLWTVVSQTGLPGALISVSFGSVRPEPIWPKLRVSPHWRLLQLMPQLIAARNPIVFMNMVGTMFVLRLCLVVETMGRRWPLTQTGGSDNACACGVVTGVTHFTWLLKGVVQAMFAIPKFDRYAAVIRALA
jgi:hypothetical protein